MLQRVPQPPIQPALRDLEHHDFWLGFVVVVIGAVLTFCGARHVTTVDTVDGGAAWETQLVKAFSTGGLRYPDAATTAPPPPDTDNPAATAEAMERWAKSEATAKTPTWHVRVDTGANTPCPT